MNNRTTTLIAMLFSFACALPAAAAGQDAPGAVYTMTNAASGNAVLIFDRNAQGLLTGAGSMATGGKGSGGGLDQLGSQGSLTLSGNGRLLFAVNAGSDELSVFSVQPQGLLLADVENSGGVFPVSVTELRGLVYVLNAGTAPNITGFAVGPAGDLEPLPGSVRTLGTGAFSQVGFDPRGKYLIVTDRQDNEILVYPLEMDGMPSATPVTTTSNGAGPFGFLFDQQGNLLVAEAGSGAVSSYRILDNGMLQVISPSVANGQVATCWIAGNGRFAFTANTGSGTLSGYELEMGKGAVELDAAAAGLGNLDIDTAISIDGRFLYTLNVGNGSIGMFRIDADGGLTDLGHAFEGDIAIFSQGLAAR